MVEIHPTIAVLRTSRGWSPSELAREAKVSYSLIRKMEQGQPISREYAQKVCDALGVKIEDVEGLNIKG